MSRTSVAALAWLAALAPIGPAQAGTWPQRPVRIVLPFAAGGASDVAARILAQRFAGALGQQFVVENRAGASGVVAAETVAHAAPDGYTLLMVTTGQLSIAPLLSKTPYDPAKDFVPVSLVGTAPFVLIVHPGIPARTLAEFIDYARARPNQLTYASSGFGSIGHLSMELFLKRAGLAIAPVMYKGGSEQLNDVIAGHVKVTMLNLSAALPFAAGDSLRLLAVTSEKRMPQMPALPTFAEAGFPSLKLSSYFGLMAPAGTDQEIVGRIAAETARAVRDPTIAALLVANGIEPAGGGPEGFAAMIAADSQLWREAIELAGLGRQ
ncbi:MAG TPA: tripartite tricarboxylate transporter substrate binding protein [Xanthobacteraceae bacterium]|nr:tripartite tricarboxylate transporter substrate binding protein [Xanthobacteraceae bacterium]